MNNNQLVETARRIGNDGMTLRDYFAGQALAGMLAYQSHDPNWTATTAYGFADAMLKEREGEDENS